LPCDFFSSPSPLDSGIEIPNTIAYIEINRLSSIFPLTESDRPPSLNYYRSFISLITAIAPLASSTALIFNSSKAMTGLIGE